MTTPSTKKSWKPTTRVGWWSVWLMLAYVVMYFITLAGVGLQFSLPPFIGILMLVCGLAASMLALIAIIRNHERSWWVWFALLPGLLVLFLLLGELLFPH